MSVASYGLYTQTNLNTNLGEVEINYNKYIRATNLQYTGPLVRHQHNVDIGCEYAGFLNKMRKRQTTLICCPIKAPHKLQLK